MQSILPNIKTFEEYMQGLSGEGYGGWGDKNFGCFKEHVEQKLFDHESFNIQSIDEKVKYVLQHYKNMIIKYCASSVSCSVDYEGYEYSTSSLYC